MKKTPVKITFEFDHEKAKQAVLWLLHRNNGSMNKLKLIKLMYFADREHLAKYGRPIVGGKYYTMKLGPVSSELLDLVNQTGADLDAESAPFVNRGRFELVARETPDEECLSESDRAVLDDIYQQYKYYNEFRLSDESHKLKAYTKNKPPRDGRAELPYEDFFEDLDEQSRKTLEMIIDEQKAWTDFK
jgi:uncharacterized phage-associated protein